VVKKSEKRTPLRINIAMILLSPHGKRTPPKLRAIMPDAKAPAERTVPRVSTLFAFSRVVRFLFWSALGMKKSMTGAKTAAMGRFM
jgi:hypothetical protein